MDKPTCATCPYFVHEPGSGRCHRHPPTILSDAEDSTLTVFPDVMVREFCGEHPDFPKWIEEQQGTAKDCTAPPE